MATNHAVVRKNGANARTQPDQAPRREQRPGLGVLDRRHVLERARRRQARVLLALSALCVAVPLMIAAIGHALVAADQVRTDSAQSRIVAALQTQQNLQLQKAQLTAPSRILSIAETELHMVTPPAVSYLSPVNPGKSVLQSHKPGTVAPVAGIRASSSTGSGP
ncbi:MAG: hypothetical protein ACRD0Z_00165 [Acidimicrobiales bacterium]